MANQSRNSVTDIWGPASPYFGEGQWSERIDYRMETEPQDWFQSCCVLCSNGCALDIGVKDGKIVGVRGRASDRVNRGRLGPKGLHGWVANSSADRLTHPLIRSGASFREATWKEAMETIVARCQEVIRDFTPGTEMPSVSATSSSGRSR